MSKIVRYTMDELAGTHNVAWFVNSYINGELDTLDVRFNRMSYREQLVEMMDSLRDSINRIDIDVVGLEYGSNDVAQLVEFSIVLEVLAVQVCIIDGVQGYRV